MSALLEFRNVRFGYGKGFGFENIDFSLLPGSFTVFLGPNGAGKTTLFKLALGLLTPDSGEVLLRDRPLKSLRPEEIARSVALLEQESTYLFPFTAEEVVRMGRFPHSGGGFWDSEEDAAVAAWAMDVTGVREFAGRSVQTLSGGERRRVEIARALCQQPKLLLLDEPAAFLDLRQQGELFTLLQKLNRDQGLAIAMISHQPGLVRNIAQRAIFLSEGRIVQEGSAQDLLSTESLIEFFQISKSFESLL